MIILVILLIKRSNTFYFLHFRKDIAPITRSQVKKMAEENALQIEELKRSQDELKDSVARITQMMEVLMRNQLVGTGGSGPTVERIPTTDRKSVV